MRSRSGAAGEILKGRLEDLPLEDILQFLQVGEKGGALFLSRSSDHLGVIGLHQGLVVHACCSEGYIPLGERLVAAGRLAEEHLRRARTHQSRHQGMRLGDALCALGLTTRDVVESEIRRSMVEAVETFLAWNEGYFEFRCGRVAVGRGMADFAADDLLELGVPPRELLLEAAVAKDRRESSLPETQPTASDRQAVSSEEDARRIEEWLGERLVLFDDLPEEDETEKEFLTVSEELLSAQGRGEMSLLLLRYASAVYAHGALLARMKGGYKVLGQYGEPFATSASSAEDLLDDAFIIDVASWNRPFAGEVLLTPQGWRRAREVEMGAVRALVVPLAVGRGLLILCCHSVTIRPDVRTAADRALVSLARQMAMAFENIELREFAPLRKLLDGGSERS